MNGFKTIRINENSDFEEKNISDFLNDRYITSLNSNAKNAYKIIFTPEALEDLDNHILWGEHKQKNMVEQGGNMIGNVYQDKSTRQIFAVVHKLIPIHGAKGTPAYLEIDLDASYEARLIEQEILEKGESGLRRVGWYHTHPGGLGVFMSGTDMQNQTRNYSKDWQFAVVLNPQKKIWRAFHGKDAKEANCIFIIGDSDKYKSAEKFIGTGMRYTGWIPNAEVAVEKCAEENINAAIESKDTSDNENAQLFVRINGEMIYVDECLLSIQSFMKKMFEKFSLSGAIEEVQNLVYHLDLDFANDGGELVISSVLCKKQYINLGRKYQISTKFDTQKNAEAVRIILHIYPENEFKKMDKDEIPGKHEFLNANELFCILSFNKEQILYCLYDCEKNQSKGIISV